jgi:hypothetical protein
MSIEFVQITDHAYKRWNERIRYCSSEYRSEVIHEIIEAVKKSKIIKKHEKLPCVMPRVDGSVYSVNEDVLFVLESIDVKTYRLITVITDFESKPLTNLSYKLEKKLQENYEHDEEKIRFKGNKIKKLRMQISKTPKRNKKRKELIKTLFETEELNKENQILNAKKSTKEGIERFKELYNKKNKNV